ncbi:hypothetical protein AB0L88_44160, partial [Saccharopolyspora shandongensis]|uniref:hypothetical protein n=1 Tax=Saccharopolyspora shandongensis TaxID=418495 RepID=UPI003419CE90
MVPALLGGLRLSGQGIPASTWSLRQSTTLPDGAIGLHDSRARPAPAGLTPVAVSRETATPPHAERPVRAETAPRTPGAQPP